MAATSIAAAILPKPLRPNGERGSRASAACRTRPTAPERPMASSSSPRAVAMPRSSSRSLSQARRKSGSHNSAARAPDASSGGHLEKSAPKAASPAESCEGSFVSLMLVSRGREPDAHLPASPGEEGFERAFADAEDFGRLALRQVLEMEQEDSRALPVRQPFQRVADGADLLLVNEAGFRQRTRVDDLVEIAYIRERPAPAQPVDGTIVADAVQPGADSRFRPPAGRVLPEA